MAWSSISKAQTWWTGGHRTNAKSNETQTAGGTVAQAGRHTKRGRPRGNEKDSQQFRELGLRRIEVPAAAPVERVNKI